MRNKSIPISAPIIQETAKGVSKDLNINDYKASNYF